MQNCERMRELIAKAQKGDDEAKNTLIVENSPLIKSVIRWYKNKGIEYDDLYQLGALGFIKAIKNFDLSYDVKFSTYCVPMIVGEIKRFMRDDGAIKVSRSIKSLNIRINKYSAFFESENQRNPTIKELASHFEVEEDDIILAMNSSSMPVSLYTPLEDGDGTLELIDRVEKESENYDIFNSIALKDIIEKLPQKDRKIILLRYFMDKTQSEIANIMNVSQVQVSRLENKILLELRKKLTS